MFAFATTCKLNLRHPL